MDSCEHVTVHVTVVEPMLLFGEETALLMMIPAIKYAFTFFLVLVMPCQARSQDFSMGAGCTYNKAYNFV